MLELGGDVIQLGETDPGRQADNRRADGQTD